MSSIAALIDRMAPPVTRRDASHVRGEEAEERVAGLANSLFRSEPWFLGARISSVDEDRRGADVVVRTLLGDVWVQVKSSAKEAQAFRKRQREGDIAIGICVVRANIERDTKLVADDLWNGVNQARDAGCVQEGPLEISYRSRTKHKRT